MVRFLKLVGKLLWNAFVLAFGGLYVFVIKHVPGVFTLFGHDSYKTKPEEQRIKARLEQRRRRYRKTPGGDDDGP